MQSPAAGQALKIGWTVAAFFIAPLSPALILGIPLVISGRMSELVWTITMAAIAGYPIAVVAGVPAYFLLKARGLTNFSVYLIGGGILGALIFLVIPFGGFVSDGLTGFFKRFSDTAAGWMSLMAFAGLLAGAVFWVIARPDK